VDAASTTLLPDDRPGPDREAFEEDTGTYSTTYHPNVSTITGSWP
jgi:hypothetical protein